MKRYWYSILLTGSIVVMATVKLSPDMLNAQTALWGTAAAEAGEESGAGTAAVGPGTSAAGAAAAIPGSSAPETIFPEGTTFAETASQSPISDDFSGALFIGDSRTVGLSEYGDLGQAKVFANSGMSVFNLFDAQVSFDGNGKQTLKEVLSSGSYRWIYLMLGINELGYDHQSIVRQYRSVVEQIRAAQPDAILVLEANLHVTGEKAAGSSIYNNQRIDALNGAVAQIAADNGCRYIDVNRLFDDENGNLSAAYSTDGAHILGKYYSVWVDWLRTNP